MSDVNRYPVMRPADPTHVVPFPGRAIPLAAAGEPVDIFDGYWIMARADGSIVAADPVAPAPTAAPAAGEPAAAAPPALPPAPTA